MILDVTKFLYTAIAKQFKISHVDCKVIAFKTNEIPEDIKSKILEQYADKYLDDCDHVVFIKGPIDKDIVERIFNATDKALGEKSNKMVVGDFKLLKMKNDEEDLGIEDQDDSDETPDSEINAIVNNDDQSDAVSDTLDSDTMSDDSSMDDSSAEDSDEVSDEEVNDIVNDDSDENDSEEDDEDSDEEKEDDDSDESDSEDDSDDIEESIQEDDENSEAASEAVKIEKPLPPVKTVFLKITLKK